jgi:hypothetical protein
MVRSGAGSREPHWALRDWLAAFGLFFATAGVVLWQNTHLAVLWDLSYVLDSAMRIALGQMPYRDFPFAHAPLSFLIQAAIIRFTGRVFFHHALYAAVVGGLGTVLAWRIVLHTLRERVAAAWAVALMLAAPLAVLGIYSILPFPAYDCDCSFSILVAVWLLQRLGEDLGAARKTTGLARGFATGAALCVPLFFKQNMGLPFLAAAGTAILFLVGARLAGRSEVRAEESLAETCSAANSRSPGTRVLLAVLAGIATTLSAAALLLHFTAGIWNYIHWTVGFAAQRRLPGITDMFGVYQDSNLLWTLPCVTIALLLLQSSLGKARWAQAAAVVLMAAPFVFTLCSLFIYDDADERGDTLLALWPMLLILAIALALWNLFKLRRVLSLPAMMPLVLLVAVNGTLMSQQLWGSTYAIWPLLLLLIAEMIAFLAERRGAGDVPGGLYFEAVGESGGSVEIRENYFSGAKAHSAFLSPNRGLNPPPPSVSPRSAPSLAATGSGMALVMAAVISATFLICGGFYMASEERLSYAQFPDGPAVHSAFPQLAGMATPGPYLPEFDELVRFADARIPAGDGVILLPGEEPFYFVTGRTPQFPVLLFDLTTDPYSPGQVVEQARQHHILWLIVKRDLQIKEDPTPQGDAVRKALLRDFALEERLAGYEVYKRKQE